MPSSSLRFATNRSNNICVPVITAVGTGVKCTETDVASTDYSQSVLLLHNNGRTHEAHVNRNTVQRLGWETLCHPSYSLDLA